MSKQIDLEKLREMAEDDVKRGRQWSTDSRDVLMLLDHVAALQKDAARLKVLLDAQDADDEECQFAVIKNAHYDCYQSSDELITAIDTAMEASNAKED